jgi:riboflavin-specific deaminase-like protein
VLPVCYMPSHMQDPASPPPIVFKRLLPPGDPLSVERIVEGLDLAGRAAALDAARMAERPDAPPRPYLLFNMVSTLDGRVTLGGRSGPLGNEADRALFHGLRTGVDAVMAGAGTIRTERYRRLVRDERNRRIRRERGLAEEPLACIVSGRLDLPADIPILADPSAHVVILTSSAASLPAQEGAQIDYIRAVNDDGRLDLPAAMAQLRERFGVRTVLCEGGPHLNSQLLAAGLVDELFLSLSPKLAGGEGTGESLRIVSGPEFEEPLQMELLAALEHDSHLFLRYRVIQPRRGRRR